MGSPVRLLAAGLLLVGLGTNISTPLLVIYRQELDLGDSATMAIFTVYVAGILSTLLIAGPVSDRFGRRRVFLPFVLVSGLASLVILLGQSSFGLILVGRYLLGAVSGAALGVGAAWMQELMGPGHEQRAAVLSTIVTYFGFGVGPPIAAFFDAIGVLPLVLPYVTHVLLIIATMPLIARIPETVAVEAAQSRAQPVRPRLGVPVAGRRVFWLVVAPAAVWVFSFPSTSFALFPVVVAEHVPGVDVALAAASASLTSWAALIARPIVARAGARSAVVIGMLLGVTGYVLGTVAFAFESPWWVLPAAVLLGASSGTITASCLGILGEVADPSERGAINSTFFLFAYPGMVMPIVLTTAAQFVGLATALVVVTFVSIGALGWSLFVRGRVETVHPV